MLRTIFHQTAVLSLAFCFAFEAHAECTVETYKANPNNCNQEETGKLVELVGSRQQLDAMLTEGVPTEGPAVGAEINCENAFKKAKVACDPMGMAGMGPGEGMIVEMALGQMAGQLAKSCKAAKNVSMIMAGVSAARATACKTTQGGCLKACNTPKESPTYEADQQLYGACHNYEQQFMMQVMQAMNYANQMLASKSCQEKSSNNVATGTPPPLPNLNVNCADPNQKRTNQTCICQDNPNASGCNPFASTNRPPGSGSITDNSTGGGAYNPGLGDGGGGGEDGLYSGSSAANGNANKVQEIGGGGGGVGGGSSGGGSGGGGSGAGAGDPAAQGFKTDMASGGGAGGGGFAGYGKGKGGEGEGSSALSRLKGMFNLKDALPDKDKMARGLAGMSKEAQADGITGAMGETLFQKASRQYKNQESRGGLIVPRK